MNTTTIGTLGALGVFRDANGRPGILVQRGTKLAHIIGRVATGSIRAIQVELREFDRLWRPLELRGGEYPPKKAAQFWLARERERKGGGLEPLMTDAVWDALRKIAQQRNGNGNGNAVKPIPVAVAAPVVVLPLRKAIRREYAPAPPVPAAPAVAAIRHGDGDAKQRAVVQMLQRPEGCTIQQAMDATGWLAHSCRGFFAGAVRKKFGLTATSVKAAGGERVYRVVAPVVSRKIIRRKT